jgi:transcription initiation factor TFIIIB Brf1 subunit/transcription initiation factor TFIIB
MTITTTYHEDVRIIGNPHKGCRHCGTVIKRTAANGRAIIYHPGTTCCTDAIKDQIRYREEDYARLRANGEQLLRVIDDLERKAQQAIGKEQSELLNEANKARAAYERHTHQFRIQTNGDPQADIIGLKNELRDLRAQLDTITRDERGW